MYLVIKRRVIIIKVIIIDITIIAVAIMSEALVDLSALMVLLLVLAVLIREHSFILTETFITLVTFAIIKYFTSDHIIQIPIMSD